LGLGLGSGLESGLESGLGGVRVRAAGAACCAFIASACALAVISCELIAALAIASCTAFGSEAMRGLLAAIVAMRSSSVSGAAGAAADVPG